MGKVRTELKDWADFWKESPVLGIFLTLVFVGFAVFLLVGVPMLVSSHMKLQETCAAKNGVVLKTSEGWACFTDKVRT